MAWHPFDKRYALQGDDGKFDSLVLRLEVPAQNSLGITGLHPVPPPYTTTRPGQERSRPRSMQSSPRVADGRMAVMGSKPGTAASAPGMTIGGGAPGGINPYTQLGTSPTASGLALNMPTLRRPITPGNPLAPAGVQLPNALPRMPLRKDATGGAIGLPGPMASPVLQATVRGRYHGS